MVRAIASFLFALALPALAAPAYRVEPASVALGEPLSVNITARADMLENLDLAPLQKDFEVRDQSQGGDGREASLSLTLYPLRTGRIVLPALGLPMRAPTVTVAERSDSVPRVVFGSETDPREYHVRQAIRLTLEACDDGSLMWQRPQLATTEGLLVRPLNEEQLDVERAGERCTAHRWHWLVQPTTAGEIVPPLPMLEANKFGKQLRFPPPPLNLNAQPVPNWLPADAAVGEPEVSIAPLPAQWPLERPLALRIEVGGNYSTEALKNLLRLQLANLPQFADYPPTVEELAGTGSVPRHALTLYAVFRERGETRLPDIVLPWYDPAGSGLHQVQLKGASLQIFDPVRQRLVAWLPGLAGASIALSIAWLLWRPIAWRVRRYRALAEMKRADSLTALVAQLCAFGFRRGALPAATLGEWKQRMQQETQTQGLAELVTTVEAAHYGEAKTAFAALQSAALACLAKARPKRAQGLKFLTREANSP